MSPKLDFESTDQVTPTDEKSPKIHGVRVIVDTTSVKKSVGTYTPDSRIYFTVNSNYKLFFIRVPKQ